jgi:hypothetical protein
MPQVWWLRGYMPFAGVIVPTILACRSGRAILPPRRGENLLVFTHKPAA